MKKDDRIYTPRFCTVRIEKVFRHEETARRAGFTEPTYFEDLEYGILGKSTGLYSMDFAAYRK